MQSTILKSLIFIALLVAVTEFSYRWYIFGSIAFDPVRFNSLSVIPASGLAELSEHPEIYYQLKPNLDTWFQGEKFRTNSFGLADKEYALEKPDNTFRVAVLGSSWTMATGVEQEQNYHSVLENQLNASYPDLNFEFINFGVEMYGLREIVGTLKYRAFNWEPDLILVSITSFTAYLKWQEATAGQALPEMGSPFFQFYLLQLLDQKFGRQLFDLSIPGRDVLGQANAQLYKDQTLRAFRELDALADERNVPLAIMWLSFGEPAGLEPQMQEVADERGILYIGAHRWLWTRKGAANNRMISNVNRHPNPNSHEIIAKTILEDLSGNNFLPGVQ